MTTSNIAQDIAQIETDAVSIGGVEWNTGQASKGMWKDELLGITPGSKEQSNEVLVPFSNCLFETLLTAKTTQVDLNKLIYTLAMHLYSDEDGSYMFKLEIQDDPIQLTAFTENSENSTIYAQLTHSTEESVSRTFQELNLLPESNRIAFASFMALTLFRLAVKPLSSVEKYINERIISTYNSLYPRLSIQLTSFIVKMDTLTLLSRIMNKSSIFFTTVMGNCMFRYKELLSQQGDSKQKLSILSGALLTHTSANGLTLISLFFSVIQRCEITYQELLLSCVSTKTIASIKRINTFTTTYLKASNQHLWKWARVYDDAYLMEYTIAKNKKMGTRLVSILDPLGVTEIWHMKFLESVTQADKTRERLFGKKFLAYHDSQSEMGHEKYNTILKTNIDSEPIEEDTDDLEFN